jgi:hypothetical protein
MTRLRVLKLGDVSLNLVYSQVRIRKENVPYPREQD